MIADLLLHKSPPPATAEDLEAFSVYPLQFPKFKKRYFCFASAKSWRDKENDDVWTLLHVLSENSNLHSLIYFQEKRRKFGGYNSSFIKWILYKFGADRITRGPTMDLYALPSTS